MKDEKNSKAKVKKNRKLKETKQPETWRTFCIMDLQVIWEEQAEMRSENERSKTIWDPKPSDLPMSSLNVSVKG